MLIWDDLNQASVRRLIVATDTAVADRLATILTFLLVSSLTWQISREIIETTAPSLSGRQYVTSARIAH